MPKTTRCEVLLSQRSRLFSQENNVDIVGVHSSILCTPTILSSTYGRFAKCSSGSQNLRDRFGASLYHFGLLWKDSPDSETSTSMGPYLDKEQGEREFAQTLVNLGYTKPKWWQYWRWSERGPSKAVLALIETMTPAKLEEGNTDG